MESNSALRLYITQLHSSAVTFDTQTRIYQVARVSFSRVQVVGVCVKRNDSQLKLDDGTGLMDVKGADQRGIQLGALVECVGGIEEPWPPSDMTRSRRWMNATHVHEVLDRNIETLRMLEVMHLYNNDYAVAVPSSPHTFQLLAFPTIENESTGGTTEPSSAESSAIAQLTTNGDQNNKSKGTSSLIEKPWEHRGASAFALETGVPPADYQFALPERDQVLIEQGAKSLEIRLNVAPYSIIHVNDRITINGKTLTTVTAVRKYSRLHSILEAENMSALLPQSSFVGSGTFNAAAAAERHYRQFISAEEEGQYGLVVFELAVSAAAPSAPKSQEEWSTLVCRHLGAKGNTGCSIADLRFRFSSLPANQLTEILTNLQFDALVVHSNGKYRLI